EIGFYPNLKLAVLSRTSEIRHEDKNRCKKRLVNYIEAECAFVNTNHPSMRRKAVSIEVDKFALKTTSNNKRDSSECRGQTLGGRIPSVCRACLPIGRQARWGTMGRRCPDTMCGNADTDDPSVHQGSLLVGNEPWRLNITRSRLHFSKSGPLVGIDVHAYRRLRNGDICIGVKNDYKKCAKTFIISWFDGGFLWDENALIMEAVYDGTEGKEVGEQWESKFKEAGIHVVNL
ncbi:unnamed protein product, partial [Darwinula stevensoni]